MSDLRQKANSAFFSWWFTLLLLSILLSGCATRGNNLTPGSMADQARKHNFAAKMALHHWNRYTVFTNKKLVPISRDYTAAVLVYNRAFGRVKLVRSCKPSETTLELSCKSPSWVMRSPERSKALVEMHRQADRLIRQHEHALKNLRDMREHLDNLAR